MSDAIDLHGIAAEAFSVLGTGRQIAPFSSRYRDFDLKQAYRVAAKVRALREQAGQTARGRKIGFTNRTTWAEFGVYAPMWGYVYDRTLFDVDAINDAFPLAGLPAPRIEPELIFGLSSAPRPGMDAKELLSCIGWVAQGFEVVQSIYPDWKFAPADTVAAFGMHAALLVGPRQPLREPKDTWLSALSSFEIDLACNDEVVDHGSARNVLDGPLFALRHLVEVLAEDGNNPQLSPGEVVTTGTLTGAPMIRPGEVWSTRLTGISLEGVRVRFS
jgi:2-oxo-3-hexenedioate decarboxylase